MLKNNILANLFGNAFIAIVSIVCIPVYVHYLGVEAYGLIGIFASLQVIFSVLDMGLSATLNREFARLSVVEDGITEQRNLLRTFEYIYFSISIGIGLIIALSAPLISKYWLNDSAISPQTVQYALIQMGILLALRWPTALYAGGLTGLQHQVTYNILNTSGEIVKAIGCIAVLAFVNNSITAFFYWQIIITAVIVLTLRVILWKKIPGHDKPFFSKPLLAKNKSFATGMGATSLVVIILTQSDKVILSKLLDLKTFGYFTLASAISSSLYRVIVPVSQAVYPRLVQLAHKEEGGSLQKLFHTACQFIITIVLPFALTIAFFSKEVIMIWTNSAEVTEAVYPLVRILIIGTACNAIVTIPYMLQLAYGWTKLGLYQNIIAIIILIPSMIYLTHEYGAYGAVWVWTILNAAYIFFSMPVMFMRLLKTEKWRWYWNDLLLPVICASVIMAGGRLLLNNMQVPGKPILIGYICLVAILALTAAAFSSNHIRGWLSLFLQKQRAGR